MKETFDQVIKNINDVLSTIKTKDFEKFSRMVELCHGETDEIMFNFQFKQISKSSNGDIEAGLQLECSEKCRFVMEALGTNGIKDEIVDVLNTRLDNVKISWLAIGCHYVYNSDSIVKVSDILMAAADYQTVKFKLNQVCYEINKEYGLKTIYDAVNISPMVMDGFYYITLNQGTDDDIIEKVSLLLTELNKSRKHKFAIRA